MEVLPTYYLAKAGPALPAPRHQLPQPLRLILVIVAALLVATACGGGESATTEDAPEEEPVADMPNEDASGPTMLEESDVFPPTPYTGPPGPLVTDLGIVFPTREAPGPRDAPKVPSGGVLVVDEQGCLRFGRPDGGFGDLPIWPYGYELTADEDGGIIVLDERDEVVARVGDEVQVDGGPSDGGDETTLRSGEGFLSEQKVQELTERCQGPYWVVGNQVTSPPALPADVTDPSPPA